MNYSEHSVTNLQTASQSASNTLNEINQIVTSLRTNKSTMLGMLLNDSISGKKIKSTVKNLETSSKEMETMLFNINMAVNDFNKSKGTYYYIVKDTSLVKDPKSTLKNINEGTDKFNQNMEALKHNFLTRSYFKKLERQEKRELKKLEQ